MNRHTTDAWKRQNSEGPDAATSPPFPNPFKRFAATLRVYKPLLLNWFKADGGFAKGATEGLNNKALGVTRRSYGFRNRRAQEIALFHALGKRTEPAWVTHRVS